MPRARKTGPYPNRTDLTAPLPVEAATGQTYGRAAEQRAAQGAIPLAPTPLAPTPQGGAPVGPAPQQAPNLEDLAAAHNGPGDSLLLNRPTERPNEPVTHGLPVGPGGGPEVLQGVGAAARETAVEQGTLRNLLTNMAAAPGATSALRDLAARANAGAM